MREATALINARATAVWDVLTDTSNVAVWASGISAIDGEIRDGAWIRITTHGSSKRIRLRVQQLPDHVMHWRGGRPLGLLRRTLTVTLTPNEELTRLRVVHELTGPLRFLAGMILPASDAALQAFADAVKARAELLDRHS
ncbi:SRPBCC family protein [Arthrobacter sp. NQ7]|uniref:SRPBCC family protein n=1 Tax=Arthrobacter sp. NQ7 TaxID=3032303 RepID=UPI00240EE414|nr:SRPBCC family protein [Arthrobacter sp. NQ7]MDJ0459869.1 SRPBCC family protein [Arthrobacter sp. NQ7]